MTTYRLDGFFRLKSPLSHIGETISNKSYLVQERILQPDGGVEDVFCYSGNAWRGQLRDLTAAYMLEALGNVRVPLDTFHLLFSGGRIGGAQSVDIEQARRMRAAVPMIALFGGGVGNQILQGKLKIGNCYPVCREAMPVLPLAWHERAATVSYASCTFEKEHSRRDDAKIESVRRHLATPEMTLLGEAAPQKKAAPVGPADQMRIGMELVTAGVTLQSWIVAEDVSEIELGALVSGLHRFSLSPSIGGKAAIGYGLCDLVYTLSGGADERPFLSVRDGQSLLAPEAQAAKDSYDQHLRQLYDALLAGKTREITEILGAA